MWKSACLLILALSINNGQSANILAYFMAPSLSHQITFQPIIRELAQRGHNLTVITPDPIRDPSLITLDEIDLHDISYAAIAKHNISSRGTKENKESDTVAFINAAMDILKDQLMHPRVQDLIKNSSKYQFDLLILEYPVTFATPLKRIFNCSMIGITSMPLHMKGNLYMGNPTHPVLYPDLNLPFSNKLSFKERVHSFLFSNLMPFFLEKYKVIFENIMAKHFSPELMKEIDVASKEFDMVFVNYNPILHVRKPNVPAVIEFHGIHIKPPKELPPDIKTFLDNATNGAVYVSFGSNIKSSELPLEKRLIILETMSKLPYKFLWKFEDDLLDVPENVRIIKWLPQQDVLRHRNIKLFITQGGLQSLDEAMYTKTPVLVIPFFGDQLGNAMKAEEAGLGKSLTFATLTKNAFKSSIVEIINDQKYKFRMEEVHDILTDQPMSALDKTVWWIEYVLRHKGARHMRCPSVDATFIEYYMIDVIGFLLSVLLLALFFIYMALKLMMKLGRVFFTWATTTTFSHKKKN